MFVTSTGFHTTMTLTLCFMCVVGVPGTQVSGWFQPAGWAGVSSSPRIAASIGFVSFCGMCQKHDSAPDSCCADVRGQIKQLTGSQHRTAVYTTSLAGVLLKHISSAPF